MNTYNLKVNDRDFTVAVHRKDEKNLYILVNERKVNVVFERLEESAPTVLSIDGQSFKVKVEGKIDDGKISAEVNGRPYEVLIERVRVERTAPKKEGKEKKKAAEAAVAGAIVAPLPGTVKSVKVKEGDGVNPGDIVVILEAMKMENEITASVAGKVKEIKVSQGQAVDGGEVLLILG